MGPQKGVALSWKPPATNADGTPLVELGGYRILYGRSADNLDQSVFIHDALILDCVIEELETGVWYFTVVTQSALGIEGPPSNIVSKIIA